MNRPLVCVGKRAFICFQVQPKGLRLRTAGHRTTGAKLHTSMTFTASANRIYDVILHINVIKIAQQLETKMKLE